MNAGIENSNHPSIYYYDGDYPSRKFSAYPENFDETVVLQGLAYDVDYYLSIMPRYGRSVLELCCGTGRVALLIAEAGYSVTGVDFSKPLLQEFDKKTQAYNPELSHRIQLIEQDVTKLSMNKTDFDAAIFPFNSLMCIAEFEKQQEALVRTAKHLRAGGLLALDLMNPFQVKQFGDPNPKPFFTRRNPNNGNRYTRFAAVGKMDNTQKQQLFGWYDELDEHGSVKRQNYEMYWRPVFPYELRLMLEKAGFTIRKIQGGHRGESFSIDSQKMIVEAEKI